MFNLVLKFVSLQPVKNIFANFLSDKLNQPKNRKTLRSIKS